MPFGLCNAPSVFQRFVDIVFHGLDKFTYVYIDDIIVYSNTAEEHLQHLKTVLERMAEYGLVTQQKKCSFFVNKVQYLGLEFDSTGYRPLPKVVPQLTDYPIPKSRKDIQKFIGLLNYYRGHIPNLASIGAPLYELLKQRRNFDWTDRHQVAFDRPDRNS